MSWFTQENFGTQQHLKQNQPQSSIVFWYFKTVKPEFYKLQKNVFISVLGWEHLIKVFQPSPDTAICCAQEELVRNFVKQKNLGS